MSAAPVPPFWLTLWARYAGVDRRVLGLFRIVLGSVLLYDLARRVPEAGRLYSNDGLLSNHFLLWSPQATPQLSLLFPFSTPTEVRVAFGLIGLVYGALLLGYRTRLAQIGSFVAIASLNARNLWFEDGGVAVLINLTAMSAFLPVGDRFSLDAIRQRFRRVRRPDEDAKIAHDEQLSRPTFVSIAVIAITLEIALIYAMNAIQKSGPTWRSGEAVHLVLWQNRIATGLAVLLREHEPSWVSPLFSRATLVLEAALPCLVLSPFWMREARTAAVVLAVGFHLSIAAMMSLGPFSYAMVALVLVMLPAASFDVLVRRFAHPLPSTTIRFDPSARGHLLLARVLASLDGDGRLLFVAEPSATFTATCDGVDAVLADAVRLALTSIRGGVFLVFLSRLHLIERARSELLLDRAVAPQRSPARPTGFGWSPSLRETTAGALLLLLAMEATTGNPVVPAALRLPVPPSLRPVIGYPRLNQGWSMFAPDAPIDDGTMVVDATTAGGRHLDPFTGSTPDFGLGRTAPVPHSVMLSDALFALHWEQNERYRIELARYLRRWQEVEKRPAEDRLVSFEVYWVSHTSPRRRGPAMGDSTRTLVLTSRD